MERLPGVPNSRLGREPRRRQDEQELQIDSFATGGDLESNSGGLSRPDHSTEIHWMFVRCLLIGALVVSWGGRLARAQEPAATGERFVYLAAGAPVFLRIEAQVDGEPLEAGRLRYARKIIEQHDTNGDGVLDREEAAQIPPLLRTGVAAEEYSLVDTWVSVDARPADDRVTVAELDDYLNRILGSPLVLVSRPQRSSQQVDLLPLLDLDGDGGLAREEFQAARGILYRQDFDEDDILAVDEIDGRQTEGGLVPRAVTESPLIPLATPADRELAARQLLARYGSTDSAGEQSIRFSRWVDGRLDQSGPGWEMKPQQVPNWLAEERDGEVVLGLRWNKKKRQRLEWVVLAAPPDWVQPLPADKGSSPRLQLRLPGVSMELAVGRQTGTASDARNFFRTRLRQLDANKDRSLDEQEFAGLSLDLQSNGLGTVPFKLVDTDRNGQVSEAELLALIDQDSGAQQTRIELVITHDSESLFEILAGRGDRRLTLRKLIEGYRRLESRDEDQDGVVRMSEIAAKYRLTAEPGKPTMFRSSNRMMRGAPPPPIPAGPTLSGPLWFQKMDRNQDGDVSAREFLGASGLFQRLDRDGDGLLSAEEAALATPTPAKSPAP
jgi:Ca2+-binding EF-hand superfamily protein